MFCVIEINQINYEAHRWGIMEISLSLVEFVIDKLPLLAVVPNWKTIHHQDRTVYVYLKRLN